MTRQIYEKAVIYCRISSTKQATDGDGLASQETRNREFAKYKNLEIVRVFKDDASGKLAKRPAMSEMLAFIKKQKTPYVVIIDDISRLARSMAAHLKLRADIARAGGILQSPSIEFGEDSDSLLVENLLASVAQHQREKNGEQTVNRMRARIMNGYWPFCAPIGYQYEKSAAGGKVLKRKEPEASIIQDVYEGFACHHFGNQAEILRFLKASPEWPKSRRDCLTIERITELLTKPIYAGMMNKPEWGIHMQPGKHEPIISVKTYQAVQDRMKSAEKTPARDKLNEAFPLRGWVGCSDCGNKFTACFSKGRSGLYPYYLCQTKNCPSGGRSVRKEKLEGEFETLLQSLQPSAEVLAVAHDMFSELWDAEMTALQSGAQHLKAEVKRIERNVEQIVDRLMEAQSPTVIATYETRIQKLESEKLEMMEKNRKMRHGSRRLRFNLSNRF